MIQTYGKGFGCVERSSYCLGILNGFDEKLHRSERERFEIAAERAWIQYAVA
jgi:hypothetical protein